MEPPLYLKIIKDNLPVLWPFITRIILGYIEGSLLDYLLTEAHNLGDLCSKKV
jgi:hypothetical protein